MFLRHLSTRLGPVLAVAFGVAVLCAVWPNPAAAQSSSRSKRTTVTLKAPTEIPGSGTQVLPAGTYVFRMVNSLSDRNIVRISSQDETHVFATVLSVPNYRLKATDKTVMTFAERAAGDPQAIRAWFYPGDNWGQEFVYPKSKAVALAKLSQQPVLYISDALAPSIIAPTRTATDAPAPALIQAPLMAVTPVGDDVAVSTVVEAPPTRNAGRLPQTASELPVLVLLGVLCLGVGLSIRPSCAR